ncbi:hypothetical protein BD413DRAFT_576745 [Trametes elegans]|nr:hypothetical protein BD413DRAFT_576745 [Trametes elegans]
MSTGATSPPTMSATPAQSKSATTFALGISLAVVATLILIGLVAYFVRRRHKLKRAKEQATEIIAHRRTYMVSVDPNHLAARVTPFGLDVPEVESPKFVHQPGQNMRVAYRRSDGGWEFHHTYAPGSSLDLTRDFATFSRANTKEQKLRPGELTTRGYVEPDVEGNPPPAYYGHDGSVLSDSTGR